ncbi:hypothetical protein J2T60_000736 [Natronospira proteinivora]|uniref:DUF4389 domain-containing protein n=1 Tax=Natronospira proteinivora TaxID=1807133 RepID=A0ABT1G646_9GAMM|nr:DUF4389 domain-containing protein [Natronospira proteinivora]MCP1726771.1 hypothetical protein [Natronospira proteinivora]
MSTDEFDTDELKEHVTARQTWLRLVYMVIFLFFAWVASFVFGVVILVLFLWHLFSGKPNPQVKAFGQSMSSWGYQVLRFLSYNSEELPFPFDAWPSGPVDGAAAPRKKATRKKAAKKKKTASTGTGGSDNESDERKNS